MEYKLPKIPATKSITRVSKLRVKQYQVLSASKRDPANETATGPPL